MTKVFAPVITIDGPSGAGKGTVAQNIADQLGFSLLDSGALYRLVALSVLEKDINPEDENAVAAIASKIDVRFESVQGQGVLTWLDGQDVTLQIRYEKTASMASVIAVHEKLRQVLLDVQRAFRKFPGLVADGRDMGTAIFPDAIVKFFLTAKAEVRAQRRFLQLKGKGIDANLTSLLEEITLRDKRDLSRTASPMKPAADAVVIDSSDLSIEDVGIQILNIVNSRGLPLSDGAL